MASGISAAPRGPAQGGEPGRSASYKAWQVQTWVFIKCPGGAGWAQMAADKWDHLVVGPLLGKLQALLW